MTKPDLGTKRLCAGCNAKFYDLHKTPIVCPTCETEFIASKPLPARSRRPVEATAGPLPVAVAPRMEDTPDTADTTDKEETEPGVPLLEEMDED